MHSSILAWETQWTEEPGGLQSSGIAESDTTERLKDNNVGDQRGGQVTAGGRQPWQPRQPPASHPTTACIAPYSCRGGPRLLSCSTVGFAPLHGCVGPGQVVPWALSSVGPHHV